MQHRPTWSRTPLWCDVQHKLNYVCVDYQLLVQYILEESMRKFEIAGAGEPNLSQGLLKATVFRDGPALRIFNLEQFFNWYR